MLQNRIDQACETRNIRTAGNNDVHTHATHNLYMWQSRIEIEDYFVVYFDRITALKVP